MDRIELGMSLAERIKDLMHEYNRECGEWKDIRRVDLPDLVKKKIYLAELDGQIQELKRTLITYFDIQFISFKMPHCSWLLVPYDMDSVKITDLQTITDMRRT